jgi:hypothetical protein
MSSAKSVAIPCAIAFLVASFTLPAAADTLTADFTVSGLSGPWEQSANPSFGYGVGDNAPPTTITAANGYNFAAGGSFTITYLSGQVSAGSGFPLSDANGDPNFVVNGANGSSGQPAPSKYVSSSQYPAFLAELIGTWANSSGAIIGTPFVVGDGPDTVTAPVGATELLLGVNDDIFSDNVGSLTVSVAGPGVAVTPIPAALPLLVSGLGALGLLGWPRKRTPRSLAA